MSTHITKLFSRQWKVLLIAGALVAVLSLGVSLVAPLEYRADAEILILTRQQTGTDPLTTSRSQERIAEQLAESVGTDLFYSQLVARPDVPAAIIDRFGGIDDERKRRRAWEKAIGARAKVGTSVMTISAYDTSREGAESLSAEVAETIVQNGTEYVGTLVVGRVVNQPIATRWPVRPNIFLNTLLGFILGIFGMAWMIVRRSKPSLF